MRFDKLINDKIFDLPINPPKSKQFDEFIKEFLNSFLQKVNALGDETLDFEELKIKTSFIKHTQSLIVQGLISVIEEYYNGFPFRAYEKLNHVLRNEIKDLYAIIKQKTYLPNESFYRIRIKEENFPMEALDLFHIPFDLRGKVTTQRFSISGFPSLYLGRTLYVCWEELNRPQIDKFQAIRLKNTEKLRFLDLTPPIIKNGALMSKEVYLYFMTFPLVACCSIKVKDYSDTFKPEYIVPQLLLQWVRNNDELDGIIYKSTHIDPQLYKQKGELANLVLPVKEKQSRGHCNKLKKMFEMTETISWQLHQYALGNKDSTYKTLDKTNIDSKLPPIEFIRGKKYPYSSSVLGSLEHFLDSMETKKIK